MSFIQIATAKDLKTPFIVFFLVLFFCVGISFTFPKTAQYTEQEVVIAHDKTRFDTNLVFEVKSFSTLSKIVQINLQMKRSDSSTATLANITHRSTSERKMKGNQTPVPFFSLKEPATLTFDQGNEYSHPLPLLTFPIDFDSLSSTISITTDFDAICGYKLYAVYYNPEITMITRANSATIFISLICISFFFSANIKGRMPRPFALVVCFILCFAFVAYSPLSYFILIFEKIQLTITSFFHTSLKIALYFLFQSSIDPNYAVHTAGAVTVFYAFYATMEFAVLHYRYSNDTAFLLGQVSTPYDLYLLIFQIVSLIGCIVAINAPKYFMKNRISSLKPNTMMGLNFILELFSISFLSILKTNSIATVYLNHIVYVAAFVLVLYFIHYPNTGVEEVTLKSSKRDTEELLEKRHTV